jgi:glycosyltransferase involved in cell wall biosynthesis
MRDREVLIVGEGPERSRLEALVRETGAPVRLLGALPNHEVRDLVEGAALFALPCVVAPDGDRDGTPAAIVEAMALEVPVVGTDEVGLPELIGPDRGRLVPPGDPDALRAAIAELLNTPPEARIAMGRAGRAWAEEHADRRTQARRLLALIDSVSHRGRHATSK